MTDTVIDLDGDHGHVDSYWQLLERDGDGHPVLAAFGRYDDRLVRDGGQWRLAARHAEIDANTHTRRPAPGQ